MEDSTTIDENSSHQSFERIILKTIKDYESKTGRVLDAPIMIGDLEEAGFYVQQWKSLLPRAEILYAVKCCSELPLLKYLADLGTSFDCASQREIETILNLGVDRLRIVFSHTIKPVSSLKYAEKKEVDFMSFDNQDELDKIKISFPSARLLIRIRCEPSEHALLNFGMKFGCPLSEVQQLLVKAKKDNLNVVGVHFHAGSFETDIYNNAIQNAKCVFETAKEMGFKFNILDIGGGFVSREGMVEFAPVAENLNKMLETYFPEEQNVRVIAEPGRFLASPVFTWVRETIKRKLTRRYRVRRQERDAGSSSVHILRERWNLRTQTS